jgi:hypothetical protein
MLKNELKIKLINKGIPTHSYSLNGYGGGFGKTSYGDAIGPDGISNEQTVGNFNLFFKD